jgi:L-ascorbate metabolism protein UlaG (beta-lactamase superfamily)
MSTPPVARVHVHICLVVMGVVAMALTRGAASTHPASQRVAAPVTARAQYLANAGVLVTHGDTSVVFDPLFRNSFGTYRMVPPSMERALFAGAAPFEGLDAVFVSHYHEDHFSAVDILRLLEARPNLRLYAPAQAVAGIRDIEPGRLAAVESRVTAIALNHRDAPVSLTHGVLTVDAVRIPHSGWPSRQQHVENIAFRVTLQAETTVVHLGDADTSDAHFVRDDAYWRGRRIDMAFPPYWFFASEAGRQVLERRIAPARSIGVHVPVDVPSRADQRAPDLRGYDLFTEPGEFRDIRRPE